MRRFWRLPVVFACGGLIIWAAFMAVLYAIGPPGFMAPLTFLFDPPFELAYAFMIRVPIIHGCFGWSPLENSIVFGGMGVIFVGQAATVGIVAEVSRRMKAYWARRKTNNLRRARR